MPVEDAEEAEDEESFGDPGLKSPTSSASSSSRVSRMFGGSGGRWERCALAKDLCRSLMLLTKGGDELGYQRYQV